ADPGSEVARWDVPPDEVLDAGEEIVIVATRAGLAQVLHLAALPAGARRTIVDLPGRATTATQGPRPFDPTEAVAAVRHGVGRVIGALPSPLGGKRGISTDD
ncbi:MAG TPA: hypothetical protein VD763_04730, partial [Candidatus Saccharimonadales bacterium]|nr:hypothetical protein [Candidatus Saccharimonadales bacterium]